MEIIEEKSLLGNSYEEEEQTMNSHVDEEGIDAQIQGGRVIHVKQANKSSRASSPKGKDLPIEKEENHLKSAKAKVEEVRDENERLKLLLAQMVREYQSLQTHILDILQKEEAKKSIHTSSTHDQETEEPELVSLSLGRSFSEPKKDGNRNLINGKQENFLTQELALGLDSRLMFNSTEIEKKPSFDKLMMKEEKSSQKGPASKISMRSGDEEDLQHAHLEKARVSVRARCDTPTMNDGCQWRKYGQKIAKGNPCPRAYYRCTASPTCPVRKQVQRWVEDRSILITTYEGTHNHPLPISAKAMVSTTSAAASMLQCRSSTSLSSPDSTSFLSNLHGSNYSFSQNERPYQLYFPNSSISAANSHPTVVLDLTAPTTSTHFDRLSSAPRFSSTSLNFSTPTSTNFFDSNHGTLSYNKNPESLNFGKHHISQSAYMNNLLTPSQQSLTETTKVITSNPNFQSALAAAITTYIGNGGTKAHQNQSAGHDSGLNLKWRESFPVTAANNGKGSVSMFPCPLLPFSTSKSVSGSPADHTKDHFK